MFHVNKGIVQVINPLHLLRFVPSSLCPVASAAVIPRASRAGSNGGINSALTQQGTTLGVRAGVGQPMVPGGAEQGSGWLCQQGPSSQHGGTHPGPICTLPKNFFHPIQNYCTKEL